MVFGPINNVTISPNPLISAKTMNAVLRLIRNKKKFVTVICTFPMKTEKIYSMTVRLSVCPTYIIVESVAPAIP